MYPIRTFYVYFKPQNNNHNLAVLKYLASVIKVLDINQSLRVLWHPVVGYALGVSDKVILGGMGRKRAAVSEERLGLPRARWLALGISANGPPQGTAKPISQLEGTLRKTHLSRGTKHWEGGNEREVLHGGICTFAKGPRPKGDPCWRIYTTKRLAHG